MSHMGHERRIYALATRAKDAGEMMQPDKHDQSYGVYVINQPN